jgi:hypothetical protein
MRLAAVRKGLSGIQGAGIRFARNRVFALMVVMFGAVVLMAAAGLVFSPAGARAQGGVWTREFGSSTHDAATSVAADGAGDAYVVGWTAGALPGQTFAGGHRDAFLRMYTRDGTVIWTRQFGTPGADTATDVAVDGATSAYVVGQTAGALPGQRLTGESDAFVRKYDSSGTELWTRQFGSTGAAAAARVIVDEFANAYVTGWAGGALPGQTHAGGSDAFVRKYDADGTELWTRQFGSVGHDRAGSLGRDSAGAIYVLGEFASPKETFVRKYAPDGTAQWTHALDVPEGEFLATMAVDTGGNVYVGGRTGGDEGEGIVRKYAPDGVALWSQEFGRPSGVSPLSMVTDLVVDASNVYVAGHAGGLLPGQAGSAAGGFDTFVIKLDLDWPRVRVETLQLASLKNDIAAKLTLDGAGDLYLAGWSSGSLPGTAPAGPSDAFVARLR